MVKLTLRRDPTLSPLDLYEFKMSLFEYGNPEDFLLFIRNFNMTLAVSGALGAGAKYQYLRILFCREALHQFDSLFDGIEGAENLNVHYIIRGLAQYFPRATCAVERKKRTVYL